MNYLIKKIISVLLPRFTRLGKQYSGKKLLSNIYNDNKNEMLPKISIVVPSYNQGQFLEDTLLSIIEQGYSDLEIIVIDGGSNDGSVDIIKKLEKHIYYWVSECDQGQAHAINKGFDKASGDILAWLNSDDLLLKNSLFIIANSFKNNPDVDVFYGHRVLCDEGGLDVGKWVCGKHSSLSTGYADFIPQETMFWQRDIWNKVGSSLDDSFQFALDWDLIMRFIRADAKMKRLPFFLGAFRLHDQQKTQAAIEDIGFAEMARVRNEHLNYLDKKGVWLSLFLLKQKGSFIIFLLRTRFYEIMWKLGIVKIG